jgi:hypothetical protein
MRDLPDDMWVDSTGAAIELHRTDGIEVVVHHDDIPEQDRTTVEGIPCTKALRTVIDLAPELSEDELRRVVDDCLARRLFTVDEARERTGEPDMRDRAGARLLVGALGRSSTG